MSSDNPVGSTGGVSSSPIPAQAERDLSKVAETAQHDLEAISRQAAEDVRELGNQAGAKVEEAKEKAKSFAMEQKDFAAGQIGGIATAIGKVADELDNSEQAVVGRYARDIASGLTNLGKTIENRDVDDLMGLAQDFGRKQPLAFLGAAALAGFVASRFALASAHRRDTKAAGGGHAGGQGGAFGFTQNSGAEPGSVNKGASYSPTGSAYGANASSSDSSGAGQGASAGTRSPSEGYRSELSQASQTGQNDRTGGF